jgi:hypothetical protein
MQDTGSTLADQVQMSTAEKQLCETDTIVQGGIKLQIDEHTTPSPNLKGEQKAEASELALMEKVQSEKAGKACPGIPHDADNRGNSDTSGIVARDVEEISSADCPVGKLAQLLSVQEITVKSIVEGETEIPALEGSVCNGLEDPKHSTDKISDAVSSPAQVEGKEMDETMNINWSADVNTDISSRKPSESSHLSPEVNVSCTSDSLERTACKQNATGGGLEALPTEELCVMLQVSDNRIQQDNEDTGVGLQGSKDEVQVLPLNLEIPENSKLADCVEDKDTELTGGITDEEEAGDDESVSSVDSFSVATTVVTRELSTQSFTVEKLEHDEESAKMAAAETSEEGGVSGPLECQLPSSESNRDAVGEASCDAGSISRTGTMAGSISVASEQQRTERDSANHSPADVMLASPSISGYSDAQSEVLYSCRLFTFPP